MVSELFFFVTCHRLELPMLETFAVEAFSAGFDFNKPSAWANAEGMTVFLSIEIEIELTTPDCMVPYTFRIERFHVIVCCFSCSFQMTD